MSNSLHLYLSRFAAPVPSGVWRVLVRQVRARITLWIARSKQRRELYELDDRMLRDIGITREQARSVADKPFWQ